MEAGQTGVGLNGKQNFLFPLEVMWLTQGYWSYTYSHNKTYAMDFQGAGFNSDHQVVRVYQCPCYAPFDCHCVRIYGSTAPAVVWTSDNEVNFIDGTTGYATIQFTHENNSPNVHHVGDSVSQGQVISHTGTMGASGDHIHIEAKKGIYEGFTYTSAGTYRLTGSAPFDNLVGVNDTYIYRGYYVNHNDERINYNWRSFVNNDPGPGPGPGPGPSGQWPAPSPFPWVLYAQKIRNKSR